MATPTTPKKVPTLTITKSGRGLCTSFLLGTCTKEKCKYSHDADTLFQALAGKENELVRKAISRSATSFIDLTGDLVKDIDNHTMAPTTTSSVDPPAVVIGKRNRVCVHFVAGTCLFTKCKYSHDEEEPAKVIAEADEIRSAIDIAEVDPVGEQHRNYGIQANKDSKSQKLASESPGPKIPNRYAYPQVDDINKRCAVLFHDGTSCNCLLICARHKGKQKHEVIGRALPYHVLLVLEEISRDYAIAWHGKYGVKDDVIFKKRVEAQGISQRRGVDGVLC